MRGGEAGIMLRDGGLWLKGGGERVCHFLCGGGVKRRRVEEEGGGGVCSVFLFLAFWFLRIQKLNWILTNIYI